MPFTPRQFPIRLSRRVGLRHMQSIGAKRLVCPSGEQIVNGGFENAWTGWEHGIDAYITNAYKRSGTWSLGLTAYSEPENFAWVKQTLTNPIPVACVDEFKLYCHADWYPSTEKKLLVTIGYTDASTTQVTVSFYETYVWHEKDLKPYLSAGKTIKYVRIESLAFADINVDDVTLTGKG